MVEIRGLSHWKRKDVPTNYFYILISVQVDIIGMGSSLGSRLKACILARKLAGPQKPAVRIWAHEH